MRIRATITLGTAALLALTGCASHTAHTPAAPPTAGHTAAVQSSTGSKDLIIPDATASQARIAIRDYARTIHGPALYYIKVMRSPDAKRYVCRARWYADANAYRAYSGTEAWPDSWPHLAVNCP